MKKLKVSIEIEGKQIFVGFITGTDYQDACFSYEEEYLENQDSRPVSLSLPLTKDTFSPLKTKNFFEGLLPEGFTRRCVAQWMHVDENDYLSIIEGLGKECLGAIRVADSDSVEEIPGYEKLSMTRVQELAKEGASKSAQIVTQTHLSLTGASGKVGLFLDENSGCWYLPKGDAPSTHILKQSHVRLSGIVTNEQLSLMTASNLGIDVPKSFIVDVGHSRDEDILFATQRYDRKNDSRGRLINGMKSPLRLHQEDFAQALGVASSDKYEKRGQNYLKRMFDLLRIYSADPIKDQLKLWDIVIFNYLIGNTDSHIKNFSLLYGDNLKTIRLAPAYDIVSTAIYDESIKRMAFHIGGEQQLNRISRNSFIDAAKDAGLGQKMALRRFDEMSAQFESALADATEALENLGFHNAEEIKQKILQNGGIGMKRKY